MFKKFFSASVLSVFLIAPGFASEVAVTVDVPASASETAEKEALLLAAAKEVCSKVDYVGIERFYASRAKAECVKETYAAALESARTAPEVLAYAETSEAVYD